MNLKYGKKVMNRILSSENVLKSHNSEKIINALKYNDNNLIEKNKMHLLVESLILINTIITGKNIMSQSNVKQSGYNKLYLFKEIIEDNLIQIQLISLMKKKISNENFYATLLKEIYPFYDRNEVLQK